MEIDKQYLSFKATEFHFLLYVFHFVLKKPSFFNLDWSEVTAFATTALRSLEYVALAPHVIKYVLSKELFEELEIVS
jgi:hypothetical protein